MHWGEMVAAFAAGTVAGTINAVVGSGSLLTFPTLMWLGLSPVGANVTNCVALVPGSVSGVWGYRGLLGHLPRRTLIRLAILAALGGVMGATALLCLPEGLFEWIVAPLIVLAVGATLGRRLIRRRAASSSRKDRAGLGLIAVLLTAVYGGYFGAAHGILMIAVLGTFFAVDLQPANALKNLLGAIANVCAAVELAIFADVAWELVALVGPGALVGGLIGGKLGPLLSERLLSALIAVIGVMALVSLYV